MKKKYFYIFSSILFIILISLTGCSFSKREDGDADTARVYEDEREILSENNASDFILTTSTGIMQLYDNTGKILDTLELDNSSKSDFIYCEDSGEIYSKNLLKKNTFNCLYYAVDKSDGKLYIVVNDRNKLKVVKSKSLKASKDIDSIKAYNGLFCYMVKGNGINAKDFTVATISTEIYGIVDYFKPVGVERRGKTYSYIYLENFSSDYLDYVGLKDTLNNDDVSNMNLATTKKTCIRIPYDVESWTLTNNQVIYFAEDVYGDYVFDTNILTACYGTHSSVAACYRPGRYASIFALNQMGDNSSKSILMSFSPDDLSSDKVIEFSEEIPLDMYVDVNSNVLYIAYKLENKTTYGKVKIYDLTTWQEINNISFDFVPTCVKGHNGFYYVMNEFEDFMAFGTNDSKDYSIINKYIKDVNANEILMCNIYKKDYFLYDANNRYMNDDGKLIDYRGNLINDEQQKVNKYGQLLDDYGRAINSNGELVDKYGNIIDENGIIIQYTQQKDGYYRSSNGTIVDATGKAMIKQEDGTYIEDVEEIPDLEWHYDENGEIVINQDYLDKYPDAKSWIAKDGTVTKGSYVDDGSADEIEENADKTTFDKIKDKIFSSDDKNDSNTEE